MAMYPNMMHPVPLKKFKSKNLNNVNEKGQINNEKEETKENKEAINPTLVKEQNEENQNKNEENVVQ